MGGCFAWKASILFLSVLIARPFCRYLCPLGALYAPFNKISVVRMKLDSQACLHCSACKNACIMGVDPSAVPNSTECIRCGMCVQACPPHALHLGTVFEKDSPKTRAAARNPEVG